MNIKAMESMEAFARTVLSASPAQQNEFWNTLKQTLSTEDVKALQRCVSSYRMFTDKQYYYAMKNAIIETLKGEYV